MLRIPSAIAKEKFDSLRIQDMTFVAYRNDVYPAKMEVFFEEYAVIYVLEGEKKFSNPSQEVIVKKGDVLFVQRGYYLMSENIDQTYKSLVFFFNEKLLKEFVSQNRELFQAEALGQSPILILKATSRFLTFARSLFPYFNTLTEYQTQFLKLKFQELILHLLEIDHTNELRSTLFKIFEGQKLDLDFVMNKYFLKNLSLDQLSKLSGRSLSAFKREFQETYGSSPAVWIKEQRLLHAQFLLKNTPQNVSEISQMVGYESVSHFIKTFKERFGFTPNKLN
jgi:AraC family transcriptional regulator, exoenzyme S synthesis regulatory protein ExsA